MYATNSRCFRTVALMLSRLSTAAAALQQQQQQGVRDWIGLTAPLAKMYLASKCGLLLLHRVLLVLPLDRKRADAPDRRAGLEEYPAELPAEWGVGVVKVGPMRTGPDDTARVVAVDQGTLQRCRWFLKTVAVRVGNLVKIGPSVNRVIWGGNWLINR